MSKRGVLCVGRSSQTTFKHICFCVRPFDFRSHRAADYANNSNSDEYGEEDDENSNGEEDDENSSDEGDDSL